VQAQRPAWQCELVALIRPAELLVSLQAALLSLLLDELQQAQRRVRRCWQDALEHLPER
jgi:hypothetical protein